MIGQAHLDPVWLWRWTEGRAEALATCQSAADRLDEYDDFHFTRGEALVYEWVEREAPELFERIKARVAEGRWHPVNGMVIQPDMNVPSGESFVRQALLGKGYMRDKLGAEPRVAYCVDSFGHAGTLPQILKGCGFDYYVFMRPQAHEKTLPAQAFWWEGPDGSRVLAFRISGAYLSRGPGQEAHIAQAVRDKPDALGDTMCFFGVGNHGGGPTRVQIEDIRRIAAESADLDVRFSSPEAYFAAIAPAAAQLPTVAEELQYHAVGCYSVVSALKRGHRQAEWSLLLAERVLTLAQSLVGYDFPAARMRELWQSLCFNEFHDTLGGSSLKSASDDAVRAFGRIIDTCDELVNDAGRLVAARVDTQGPGGAVLLFNPHPEPTSAFVEYEPWTDWEPWEGRTPGQGQPWGLADEGGAPVPYQKLESDAAIWNGINRLAFRAELPPLGYRLYRFAPGIERAPQAGSARATPASLENDKLLLRLDPHSGAISSCQHRASGLELVGGGGWNVPQAIDDHSDTWSHGVRGYNGPARTWQLSRIGVIEAGPLQASLLVERRCDDGVWRQQLVLRDGEEHITIRNWLNWHGEWSVVKLAFDVAASEPRSFHDVPFGWAERPCDGAEVPTQQWMAVQGTASSAPDGATLGAALLNDGKYGCDVTGSTMRLTILRAVPYAYHVPHVVGTKRRYDWVDQGAQEFTLVLKPFAGDWRDAGVVRAARELHLPPVAITAYGHPGELAASHSLVSLDAPELELTALKPADDGDGFVARIADRHGRGGAGALMWRGQRFEIAARPFEVLTLRLRERDGAWQAAQTDMLERDA